MKSTFVFDSMCIRVGMLMKKSQFVVIDKIHIRVIFVFDMG